MNPADQANTWLKEIEATLLRDVDGILGGQFFTTLQNGHLSLDGLRRFASEYYLASNGFPKLLALACAAMPTDELRLPFVRNLWDEHGQGVPMKSHRGMLAKFLKHLEVVPQMNPQGPADRYVKAMSSLCERANAATMLGIFGPGCESFTPREYRIIVKCLRSKFALPDEAIEFFLDHIKHDHEHVDWLNKAFRIALRSHTDVDDAINGARASIAVECQFWNDMYDYCR